MSVETLLEIVRPHTDRLFPIASISPLTSLPDVAVFKNMLANKLVYGLKLYLGYEYFYPCDERLFPYYQLLSDTGHPAIFHTGDTYSEVGCAKLKYAHPLHIDDLAVEFPNLKIVIAHMGYPWQIDAGQVCYKNKNVFVDISGLTYGSFSEKGERHFQEIVQTFLQVSDRPDAMMYGSDWPIATPASYLATVERIIPPEHLADVAWKTATRVFGLPISLDT